MSDADHFRTAQILRATLDVNPDVYFVKDLEHRLLYVNQSLAKSMNLTCEQMEGQLDTEFWPIEVCEGNPETGRRGYHDEDREAFSGKSVCSKEVVVFDDGLEHVFYTYRVPVRDANGKVCAILGHARDVTDSLLLEKRTRELETVAHFREVIEATNDGIWVWNPLSDEDYLSPRWKEILGFADDELENRISIFFDRLHPDDETRVRAAMKSHMENQKVYSHEFRLRHKDGSYRDVVSRGAAVRDENGTTIRMVGAITDITERNKAERKIAQNLDEKDALLRELHHRTKNNMQVIKSMLYLGAQHSNNVKQTFQDIGNRINAMALVHSQLCQSSDLSRIHVRSYVTTLLQTIMHTYGVSISRIELIINVDDLTMSIDTAMPFGLILNELMTNALKHGFPGNRKGQIRVAIRRSPEQCTEIIFSDDGVGVPDGLNPKGVKTLGLRTIVSIAEHQLHGRVTFELTSGLKCMIIFNDQTKVPLA